MPETQIKSGNKNSIHSAFREKMIEHLFIGELLKHSWKQGDCSIEIARAEVDNGGYDLIAVANGVTRFIQLKAMVTTGKRAVLTINKNLEKKSTACIIWIAFDEKKSRIDSYRFFGELPNGVFKLPVDAKPAKHTKGDSEGTKKVRPNIVNLNKGQFKKEFDNIEELYEVLFDMK